MAAFHRELLDVVPFEVYKVCSAFSRVDLTLEMYASEESFGVVIRAGEVFEFERLEAKPENQDAFKFITNSRSRPWPPYHSKPLSERRVVLDISQ